MFIEVATRTLKNFYAQNSQFVGKPKDLTILLKDINPHFGISNITRMSRNQILVLSRDSILKLRRRGVSLKELDWLLFH